MEMGSAKTCACIIREVSMATCLIEIGMVILTCVYASWVTGPARGEIALFSRVVAVLIVTGPDNTPSWEVAKGKDAETE
jgi:hypothetical protein